MCPDVDVRRNVGVPLKSLVITCAVTCGSLFFFVSFSGIMNLSVGGFAADLNKSSASCLWMLTSEETLEPAWWTDGHKSASSKPLLVQNRRKTPEPPAPSSWVIQSDGLFINLLLEKLNLDTTTKIICKKM